MGDTSTIEPKKCPSGARRAVSWPPRKIHGGRSYDAKRDIDAAHRCRRKRYGPPRSGGGLVDIAQRTGTDARSDILHEHAPPSPVARRYWPPYLSGPTRSPGRNAGREPRPSGTTARFSTFGRFDRAVARARLWLINLGVGAVIFYPSPATPARCYPQIRRRGHLFSRVSRIAKFNGARGTARGGESRKGNRAIGIEVPGFPNARHSRSISARVSHMIGRAHPIVLGPNLRIVNKRAK